MNYDYLKLLIVIRRIKNITNDIGNCFSNYYYFILRWAMALFSMLFTDQNCKT